MTVAILIPTKDRPGFLKRNISYYNSLQSKHNLYVGDASDKSTSAQIEDFLKSIQNTSVTYFHWENLKANQAIVRLAKEAAKRDKSCAFHGDDDFFVPSSLDACANFLDANSNYRTAQGRAGVFELDRSGPYGEIKTVGEYWGVKSLDADDPLDRLRQFHRNYFVTQFSVHRTDEFIDDSKSYVELLDDSLGELLHCHIFALKGKSKFDDCFYLARNIHQGINHPKFLAWCTRKHWSDDYYRATCALCREIENVAGVNHEEAKHLASDIFLGCFADDPAGHPCFIPGTGFILQAVPKRRRRVPGSPGNRGAFHDRQP